MGQVGRGHSDGRAAPLSADSGSPFVYLGSRSRDVVAHSCGRLGLGHRSHGGFR